MERKRIFVSYSGSGVNSLRVISVILILLSIVGVILFFAGISYMDSYYDSEKAIGSTLVTVAPFLVLQGIIFAPILRGLATIAETALIKKHIIEQEYEINKK